MKVVYDMICLHISSCSKIIRQVQAAVPVGGLQLPVVLRQDLGHLLVLDLE